MNEDGGISAINRQFPDVQPMRMDLSIPQWFGVIDQLKEQPLKEMADFKQNAYRSRWDGIAVLTRTQLALNRRK